MSDILRPATEWELKSLVAQVIERQIRVEVLGAGTKRGFGRPPSTEIALSTSSLRGVTLYEPTELVMSARAGTPVSQIEVELASRNQILPWEPAEPGPMLGGLPGQQTIGGVFATNLSGPRRITAGAARDHLIGVQGINGRGESFKSGGRVMKNVTGYDIARGLCGSWGTLAFLTEVTFKVLPMPDDAATLIYFGHNDDIGAELTSAAMTSPFEVSGTAHLSRGLVTRLTLNALSSIGQPLTAIRIENFSKSVAYRKDRLKTLLSAYGAPLELDLEGSLKFWGELRRLAVFPPGPAHIWRISTSPTAGPALAANIRRHMSIETYYDWSGGLIWLETPASADAGAADIRRAVASHGGHAMLMRAGDDVRRTVDVFQPLSPAVERISRGIKASFDPLGLLNPGRMYAGM